MKIKLLLAPSLVVATLVLLIWFVYPAYTNPPIADPSIPTGGIMSGKNDGVKERYEALQAEEKKLSTVDERMSHAKSLSADIAANNDKKEALYAFIPDSSKEEELIDMINYIAGKEGLSVINISVIPAKEDAVLSGAAAAASSPDPQAVSPVTAKDVEVDLVVMGGYEQIKNVVGRIYLLKRFNKLTNLSIVPAANVDGNQDGNTLQMNITLLFDMLKKSSSLVSAENPVFTNAKFNMAVINNIQTVKEGEILKLESGPLGTVANPFLP